MRKIPRQSEMNTETESESEQSTSPADGEVDVTASEETSSEENEWDALLEEDEVVSPEGETSEENEEVEGEELAASAGDESEEEVPSEKEEPPETPSAEDTTQEEEEEEVVIPPRSEEPEVQQTPEEIKAAQEEARAKAREELKRKFQLTEEQKEAFIADPSTVLSELASDLFLDIYDSLMVGVSGMVPQVVTSVIQQREAQQEVDRRFFSAWPQLAKPEYRATIDRIAENYRRLNPDASDEDAIAEIGAQAWVALRLPIEELAQLTQQSSSIQEEEPEPQANVTHIPANPGRVPKATITPPQKGNEFTELAEEFIQEDLA